MSDIPEKKIDEDWKQEVEREKERLRQKEEQLRRKKEQPPPPADFAALVSSLVMQALVHLGALEAPDGSRRQDLAAAQFTIDLLGVLEKKTRGNLTPQEEQLLRDALYDLRMRFVQAKTTGKT